MKSFLKATLTLLVLIFVCVFMFTACDEKDHEHTWGEWNTVENASCTKEGKQERSCSCGEKESQSIPMVSHTVVLDAAVSATCGNTGLTEGSHCSACGTIIVSQQTVEKAEHQYDFENIVWNWSGYDSAIATLTCVNDQTHTRAINANITGETLTSASCSATGLQKYTATIKVDGVSYVSEKEATLEKIPHTEELIPKVPATCQKTGLTEGKKCSVCGDVLLEQTEIPLVAHTEATVPAVAATCTETGLTEGKKCSACDEVLVAQEEVPALGHTEVADEAIAPTCTEIGLTEGKHCSVCSGVLIAQKEVPALGHTEVIDAAVASDCINSGLSEGIHCSVCHEVLIAQEIVPANGHTEVIDMAVDPTCTTAGLSEGIHCSVCDEVLVSQEEVPAFGHVEIVDEAVAPTCTETGLTEGKYCAVCDEVFVAQEEIQALGHTDVVDAAIAPTCTETGLTEGKHCSVCSEVLVEQQPVEILPHTEEPIIGTAATCYEAGWSDGIQCSVCYEILVPQTILLPIPCDYESVVTDPTCEEQGYTTYTCTMCNYSYLDDYVDARGHSWGDWEVKGSHTLRYCENDCGEYQSITSIIANYTGIRLLTGESVWIDDIIVFATLSDESIVSISDFTLENDVMTVDGANYVTVNFKTLSTTFSVPAIYNNLPGTTSPSEFTYVYAEEYDAIAITGFIGSSTDIIIPAHINRVPVRYIGESAFNGQENIKSVVVPDSIYGVGANAFNNCKRMTSLTLGKGLTFLDIGAFANCISLTTVDIPANVLALESPYWSDDYGVFENCTALTKVTIGNDELDIAETYIGDRAFQNCSLLNELTIGSNVKVLGESAFNGCTSLTTLTIGSGVEIISAYAFNNCENLKAVAIPNSVTTIGSHAFNNCKRMATLTLGNGLTFLDIGAFANCISLKTVDIPASVLTLESPSWSDDFGVFENCTGLTKVTIGDETSDVAETVVGESAFQNCTKLAEVFIGNKVKIIGENAFNGCTALVTLTIGTGVTNINAYAFNNCESLISVDIPDSVVTIGSHAFNNCKRMTSLTFGSGLTFLDIGAFANCSKLTSIIIPVNVLTLESPYWSDEFGVFENCTGLTKVTIGDDTVDIAETVIGKRAFKNCTSLVELYIGNKVKIIGESSFEGCTALTMLTIGFGLQEIHAFAFNNCEVLASVQIPDSVKTIGSHAFNNCKKMMALTLGKGLTYLDIGAFANCISLTDLTIPTNVLTLESPYWNDDFGVFENCTGLKKVTIGDDTVDIAETVIGKRAFKNCTSLVELYIGNKVKIIGESSFEGCTALTTLTIGSGVQEIHAYAFNNCEAITSVTIPDSVLTIGSHAFNNCKKMTALSLGKGLTYLDIGAFANCISLTSLNIPANVLTLESPYWSDDFGVFENCTGLVKVIIGDDTVDIPETTIGERAFKGCTALEEVYIGSNVKTIADNAFEGCVSLTDVQLGTGAQSVGSYAFSGCTDLTSITIPSNIMSLGNDVFNGCTSLETVTIEKSKEPLRSFGSNVFSDCTSFDRVYYTGTADDWSLITISEDNCYPLNVTPYYYSESKPTTVDNYWYYNGNGAKRVWNVSETSFDAEYSSENFVELFGGEDSSYSTTFFNELDNDSNFKSGLYAWEALHMIADTSFSEGVWKVSKKDLYKLVIFDLLCGETNAQETIFDAFDTSTVAYIDDLAKDIFGQEVTHDFLKSISPKLDYSTKLVKYNVLGLQYIFESHSNMYDALKSCATYLVLADMDESFQTVLLQIANDSSNPWELREAAREYAEIFKMSASQILANYAIEYYTSDVRAAFTIFSDLLWDKTVEMVFPEFAVAQSIAKGILFLADLGCNIDGIYMAYYKLDVAVHLDASLRKIIHNTQPDYFRVTNRANSEIYVYAVDMYKTSVLLGFDYSNNLLREDCEKKSDEEKDAYIAMMNNISSMKADKQILYNSFDNLVSQAYIAY